MELWETGPRAMGGEHSLDCINALGSLGIFLANGIMTVLMVVFGGVFCDYSYAFSLSLSIYGAVFFYVLFVIQHRRWNPLVPLHAYRRKEVLGVLHRQGFCTGLSWCVNYTLLLLANPSVPGLLQLVLNSSGLVVVVLLSMLFLGNRYSSAQWLCVAAVTAGGLLAALDATGSDGQVIWALLYALGAWSIGLANLLTENVMRNVHRQCGCIEEEREPLISVVQFLFVVKLYGIPGTLALFWIARAAQGPAWSRHLLGGLRCVWAGDCAGAACLGGDSEAAGLLAMWIASTLSFVTVLVAAGVQRRRDAVYVGVAHALAPVLSMVVLMQRGIMGRFYTQPHASQILSNVVTLVGGVAYTAVTLMQEKRIPRTTCLSRAFKFEPFREALDALDNLPSRRSTQPC